MPRILHKVTMTNEVTTATRVNLGILGTLLTVSIGGAFYLADLGSSIRSIKENLSEIKTELRDGSIATVMLNRAVASIEAKMDAFDKRITMLEGKAR